MGDKEVQGRKALIVAVAAVLLGAAGYTAIVMRRPATQVDAREAQKRLEHERALKSLKETQDEVAKLKANGVR